MPRYDLDGQVAIVTGGARGIGRAIALRLSAEGVAVAVGDVDEPGVREVAREAVAAGGRSIGRYLDVGREPDVARFVGETVEAFGRVDILVNNAGVMRVSPLLDISEAEWDTVIDVNVKGVLLCTQTVARQMITQGAGGRIINAASGAAKMAPNLPIGAYAVSKHAVLGLTRCLAVELAPHDILVNCYCPGVVDTEMWDLIDRDVAAARGVSVGSVRADALKTIPLGRLQTPDDVANVVAFLASADASYVTAEAVNNSGGLLTF